MKTFIWLFIFFTLSVTPALAQKKVARVKLLRGDVDVLTIGKTQKLKVADSIEEGSVVKTHKKSFVKIEFFDKSQMNIGPESEMKIESFTGKDSGVIDLVKGKIRSQVTKDYLFLDKNKSKLFIKTQNAVMGVRGTDFMINSNGKSSSVILFEGEVAFNRLDDQKISDSDKLERIVDAGVKMRPGEFSVVEQNRPAPTPPSLLNVKQRENLENNDGTETERAPSSESKTDTHKSVVPEGLSGDVVSNTSDSLKTEVAQVMASSADLPASSKVEGFTDGDKMKPANGSFLHVESGTIIPPAPDSILDTNSNTYVSGTGNGSVASNGDYIPPKDMVINDQGVFWISQAEGGPPTLIPIGDRKPGSAPFSEHQPPMLLAKPYNDPLSGVQNDIKIQNQIEQSQTPFTNATITIGTKP